MPDPLITALLDADAEADRLADFDDREPRVAAANVARDAAIARLSAVLAAARNLVAAVRADNCEPSGAVEFATECLEAALEGRPAPR